MSKYKIYVLLQLMLLLIIFTSCTQSVQKSESGNLENNMKASDPHSYSQPLEAVINHLDWDARVDFQKRTINGVATFNVTAAENSKRIVLDTKDLTIDSVLVDDKLSSFELGNPTNEKYLGSPLSIPISSETKKVTIHYSTSDHADALQWLDPSQTAGKEHPFLFTQSQAILARTWIPVQDSPGIRFTYTAKVEVPRGLMALMSAENPTEKSDDGVYHFNMDQPIPAYLMALAVGDLVYEPIGQQTGVYAEPSVIEEAVHEFADLDIMLKTAEKMYGEYRWGKYDLIVLPPSFPFGGMENPRLTFVTPTILAGDRSLTSLVAHELAHSWSGNLVTNANWNDFWLNEGFTVYFERRIMEEMYGPSYADMLAVLGYQDLKQTVSELKEENKAEDTHLKLDLEGRNPDDGMTDIAYEKGYSFLKMIEEIVGRENFDAFLINYFNENAFKSLTTEDFIAYLKKNLLEKHDLTEEDIKLDAWIFGEGIPENAIEVTSERFQAVDEALANWKSGTAPSDLNTKDWSSHEWQRFLRGLPDKMSNEQMKQLDQAFGFTKTGNSEMLAVWLQHAIKNEYEAAYNKLEQFLVNTGRRKFLVPLYSEMIKTENGKEMAKKIYEKARGNYHSVSTNTLDDLLKYKV